MLLRKTCDTLDRQGYTADLKKKDETTYSLMLSNRESNHIIAIEYKYTLDTTIEEPKGRLIMEVDVKVRQQWIPHGNIQEYLHSTVSWSDPPDSELWKPWRSLATKTLTFAIGNTQYQLNLRLDYAPRSRYAVGVEVIRY